MNKLENQKTASNQDDSPDDNSQRGVELLVGGKGPCFVFRNHKNRLAEKKGIANGKDAPRCVGEELAGIGIARTAWEAKFEA